MRVETHFEELKDTSLPLPIWYQDRLAKQWKSGKLILQGKGDGGHGFRWTLGVGDGQGGLPAVHGVTKSWTRLSDFTFTFHFHALEEDMATHSSVLA